MKRSTLLGVGAAAVAAAALLALLLRPGASARRPDGRPTRTSRPPGADLRVRIEAEPGSAIVGTDVRLAAIVERGADRRGALHYRWIATRGALASGDRDDAVWSAPGKPGRYAVGVMVQDDDGTAKGQAMLEVRLPSPREVADLAALMKRLAARRAATTAELAALERRVEELRAIGAVRDTIADRLHAQAALEEMAADLVELGRVEEARDVYGELLRGMLPSDAKFRPYQAAYGDVAFLLGDEDAALRAWKDGGDYVQGMSLYYEGEVLERRGDVDGALDAYQRAEDGGKWFGDPVYRHALLSLQGGASAEDVAQLLVDASPRLDRDRMLERLDGDPELAPLRQVLDQTGQVDALEAQRALVIESDAPTP